MLRLATRCRDFDDVCVMFRSRHHIFPEGCFGTAVCESRRSRNNQQQVNMNINSIGSSALSALINASTNQTKNSPSSIAPAANGAAPTNISKPAELLQKLQQLQQQDPAQFKQVMSQLADTLQQVADKSGNSNGIASKLAAAFKSASDSGDLSALQSAMQPPNVATAAQAQGAGATASAPQGAQGHHHGHHHQGGGGGIAAAFSAAISQIDAALQASNAAGASAVSTSSSK